MARKKGNKLKLTVVERVRLHRQRKKLLFHQNQRINEQLELIEQKNQNAESSSSDESQSNSVKCTQIETDLRTWANEHRISKRALNKLLSILQINGMSSLPKNYRNLQGTPVNVEISDAAGGHLWHNGLRNCLKNIFSTLSQNLIVILNFNIDGLPIYKSSKLTFWPILASIDGMYLNRKTNHSFNIY